MRIGDWWDKTEDDILAYIQAFMTAVKEPNKIYYNQLVAGILGSMYKFHIMANA